MESVKGEEVERWTKMEILMVDWTSIIFLRGVS